MSHYAIGRHHLRKDFSRIKKVMEMPNLLEVQKEPIISFCSGMLNRKIVLTLVLRAFSEVSIQLRIFQKVPHSST